MGLRRYGRKARRWAHRAASGVADQAKRSGQQASQAWDRYKDIIIPVAAGVLGFAVGGPLGAAAGASLASGGVSAYQSKKAEDAAERQMRTMESGLSQAYSRRRMSRAGGDAVVDFDSEVPTAAA